MFRSIHEIAYSPNTLKLNGDNQMIKPEQPDISRPFAIGVAIGALVLTFFGAFWASEAISNWSQAPTYLYWIISLLVLGLTLFAVSRLISVVKRPQQTHEDLHARDGKKTGIIFGIIFAEVNIYP